MSDYEHMRTADILTEALLDWIAVLHWFSISDRNTLKRSIGGAFEAN
jgi:hypothetical protein